MTDPTPSPELPPTHSEARTTLFVIIAVAAISTAAGVLNAMASTHTEIVAGFILLFGGNSAALTALVLLRRGGAGRAALGRVGGSGCGATFCFTVPQA